MKDINLSEINDFFCSTFAGSDALHIPLNIDNVINLLPFASKLISSKYETHIRTGIITSKNILKMFAERITSAKKVTITGGVDMAREERLKKYDNIIEFFEQIYQNSHLIKLSKKSSGSEVNIHTNIFRMLSFLLKFY